MIDLQARVIRYLATIDDYAAQTAAGVRIFGKRYRRDVEPMVVEASR